MIQKLLNKIWNTILKLNTALIQWFGLHLHEREMESLTRAEINLLYLGNHRLQFIRAVAMGIIGGVAVGMVIGVSLVSMMRAW